MVGIAGPVLARATDRTGGMEFFGGSDEHTDDEAAVSLSAEATDGLTLS